MAILRSNHLSLDFKIRSRSEEDWCDSEVQVTICAAPGVALLRPEAMSPRRLPNDPPPDGSLCVGAPILDLLDAIRACEAKNLVTDCGTGNLYFAFYPGLYYPHIVERAYNDARRIPNRNAYPVDDCFTIVISIPSHWFAGPSDIRFSADPTKEPIQPTAVTLQLLVLRDDLIAFADSLENEFSAAPVLEEP